MREQVFQEAVLGFLGVDWRGSRAARRDQPLGGHCNGAAVEECRAIFGNGLATVCATCPD
ncbi:hypothetical protein [Pseudodesulfovibrio pelocollis]|uniref:hypothetical protein n=1 Tax=Pseudodesulfovibrio pelocollis TaxID=3051432 RepID=UPI00255B0E18|nr:hypothetical protein [Pseudodesulfovibrio sp. SB368]